MKMSLVPCIFISFLLSSLFYFSQFDNKWSSENNFQKKFQFPETGCMSLIAKNISDSIFTDMEMVFNGNIFPSIITSDGSGRLGNQIGRYASLLYFQTVHGMHAIMSDSQLSKLANVFNPEMFQIRTRSIKMPPQLNFKWKAVAIQGGGTTRHFPTEEFLENIEEYKYNQFLKIGTYANYIFLYKEILDTIRENFQFHSDTQSLVSQWMEDIRREHGELTENETRKEVVFVGVHCRRTDYLDFMKTDYVGNVTEIDHHFFDRAFSIYRSRYNSLMTKVIFLAISDDPAWIKKNFAAHEDVRIVMDFSKGKVDDENRVGFDMCVMASSDHSIITIGTFGQWCALLAGGDVVSVTGHSQELTNREDIVYRKAAMVNWVFLNVRDVNNITELTYGLDLI